MKEQGRIIEVSAGLIVREGKLLITQRRADSHLGGLWEFPGGKREPDETSEECLVRELREELGVEVEVRELVESMTHAYPAKTVELKFFLCRLLSGEPRPLDCAAVAWITREQLKDFEFPAADERLIHKLSGAFFFDDPENIDASVGRAQKAKSVQSRLS